MDGAAGARQRIGQSSWSIVAWYACMQVGQNVLHRKAIERSPWPAKPGARARPGPLLPPDDRPDPWPNRRCIAASLLFHLALLIGIFLLPRAEPPVDVVAVPVQ